MSTESFQTFGSAGFLSVAHSPIYDLSTVWSVGSGMSWAQSSSRGGTLVHLLSINRPQCSLCTVNLRLGFEAWHRCISMESGSSSLRQHEVSPLDYLFCPQTLFTHRAGVFAFVDFCFSFFNVSRLVTKLGRPFCARLLDASVPSWWFTTK